MHLLKSSAVNRDRILAALLAPAIAFAFIVGVMGLHRGYGLARAIITVVLTAWILFNGLTKTPFLQRVSNRVRGMLGLGVSALMSIEIARVIHIMATDGFVVGDLLVLVLDVVLFGYVFAWGLGTAGASPAGLLFRAAVRANKSDHDKALRLANITTRLYRRWDQGWLLKASLTEERDGMSAQVVVLKQGRRYCPRSEGITAVLISSLYVNGDSEEAETLLREYKERSPESGRPDFFDALNAIGEEDWETAREKFAAARKKAEKQRDEDVLSDVGAAVARHVDHFERSLAQEPLEGAIRIDPGNPVPLARLAIFLEADQPSRSLALLDQARQALRNRGTDPNFDDFVAVQRRYFDPSTSS
jgi:hypothetical protein